jgi:hypothetical protein
MITRENVYQYTGSLYDGGWRSIDREQLISEYDLTEDEADVLTEALDEFEHKHPHHISIDNGNDFVDPVEAVESMDWDVIVNAMDDDTREAVNAELAPCTNEAFLTRYLQLAPEDLIVG